MEQRGRTSVKFDVRQRDQGPFLVDRHLFANLGIEDGNRDRFTIQKAHNDPARTGKLNFLHATDERVALKLQPEFLQVNVEGGKPLVVGLPRKPLEKRLGTAAKPGRGRWVEHDLTKFDRVSGLLVQPTYRSRPGKIAKV